MFEKPDPDSDHWHERVRFYINMMNFVLKTRRFVSKTRRFVSKTRRFVSKTRDFVSKTRKFVSKTRKFVLYMMNSAGVENDVAAGKNAGFCPENAGF